MNGGKIITTRGRIQKKELEVYCFASEYANVISVLPYNKLVDVEPYNEIWLRIKDEEICGYVKKKWVEVISESIKGSYIGKVVLGRLNLRRYAKQSSDCLCKIPEETVLDIVDYDPFGEWYWTCYDGHSGYVMKKFVHIMQEQISYTYGQTIIDDLNIRKEPRRSAIRWNNVWPEKRIALMKPVNENWFETLYRGEQAFVLAEFITLLDCEVPADIVQRMLYMVKPEIGRVNSVYFNGYTGQWCHRFADWLAMHAGTPKNLIPNTSNCGKGIVWFVNDTESGGFYFKNAEHKARMISNYSAIRHLPKELTEEEEAYTPSPGDYIYFRWRNAAKDVNVSHVGIVSGVSEDKLTTVEGNAGGAVANRSYALNDDRIVGYGKPRYDAVG